MPPIRPLVFAVLALALLGFGPAARAEFTLDLDEVRRLAASLPGDAPSEIRYEQVARFAFYDAMLVGGDPWRPAPLPVIAYQLVFPSQTILVDTGLDAATAKHTLLLRDFDAAASERVRAAMARAAQIVITHEHEAHIGNIASYPALETLTPALRLTAEQLANRAGMKPAVLPTAPFASYTPLHYEHLYALAPGVVLIKAPGHSPGSQIVYVRLANGHELLLIGDVCTRLRNIELERERPWFMTFVIGENRAQVLEQLHVLHGLMQTEPALAILPNHDGAALAALAARGWLQPGFVPVP